MKKTPVDILVDHFGSQSAVAKAADLDSYQSVQQWKGRVPPPHVLKLCEASDWAITPHMLRPDLYPNQDDAMPRPMKVAA